MDTALNALSYALETGPASHDVDISSQEDMEASWERIEEDPAVPPSVNP